MPGSGGIGVDVMVGGEGTSVGGGGIGVGVLE